MGDTVSLSALFVSAFTSATLLPGTSDAALVAVLWHNPALAWQALAVATLGNSLGGMLSYGLGRLLPEKIRHRFSDKTVRYCQRWGAPVLLLSWLPLLGAATGALLVPADALEPVATTTLLSAWGAGAASLALWLRLRSACAATGALAWTTVAALATAILVLDVPRTSVVVISLALGALFITLVPAVSLSSVPDQQLLDLSEQRAGSRGVRVPTVEPPARVTGARISRTLDQAESMSVATGAVIAVVVVACSPAAVAVALGSGPSAWGARVELILVTALLLLHPRTARSHTERVLPRLAVGAAAIVSILSSGSQPGTATFTLLIGIAAGAGLVSVVIMFTRLGGRPSAWWGRFGDILGSLAGFLALPSAVVAAGIIDFMRQL
mgnify:CR=1 FL=1